MGGVGGGGGVRRGGGGGGRAGVGGGGGGGKKKKGKGKFFVFGVLNILICIGKKYGVGTNSASRFSLIFFFLQIKT